MFAWADPRAIRTRCVPLAMPPLFTCLWSTDPRARVCRPYAHSPAPEKIVAIEVGTGCARKGAGRMPNQANLAQGNPNSMPQNWACSKSLRIAGPRVTYPRVRSPAVTTPTTSPTATYRMRKRLAGHPGESRAFSAAAMARVPPFRLRAAARRTDETRVRRVAVPKWFFVHNHLSTVHAIARFNYPTSAPSPRAPSSSRPSASSTGSVPRWCTLTSPPGSRLPTDLPSARWVASALSVRSRPACSA